MKPLDQSASDDSKTRVVPDGERGETLEVQKIFTAIGKEHEEAWHLPTSVTNKILSLAIARHPASIRG